MIDESFGFQLRTKVLYDLDFFDVAKTKKDCFD